MSEIKYPTDLKEIIALCRKSGVKSIKIEGIELELLEEVPPSTYKRKKLEVASDKPEQSMTDDDYLMWSVQQEEAS